ncbi:50S ribosomal protein L1 [Candidatus Uhrbacteria bacterium RIFCSPLOWO2_01_FULL_53_9]|uniref:Large ribosomal subunit protein uL1 n=2 Tax=Candidatus Uhriibacteriota TaxID=1752732 RepID=A0A1F7V0H2_9BACT|nr:MAG: 50S ribosomal protein L1 [Candidatus Uhrbacteria bacterium RIFCSPHIGHO2_02_FULL_53_13]OGL83548.1 MAG: 50S ribosomal protein L1 [Candidatus Uhrbacteria bacterium RIFCSPLOWO2_01_FULL_53_9]
MKLSKRMNALKGKVEKGRVYTKQEAVALALETSNVKFDAGVELHMRLGIDPKKGDQQVRATVTLPHGTGNTKRVAAFVDGEHEVEAKNAGADFVFGEQDIEAIAQKKQIDFDVAIATPAMMPKLAKIAPILGPKGLMPNPKTDTVGKNVGKMIADQKGGKIAFKNDTTANMHVLIGKVSFGPEKIAANLDAILDAIRRHKPSGSKGVYMKTATLTTSMGPGIAFDTAA